MTSAGGTFNGTTLPDAFVGVPYLVGLPFTGPVSGNITGTALASFPPGLTVNPAGVVSGTVAVTTSTGTQVDGPYTANVTATNAQGTTASAALVINVHYFPGNQSGSQDLSVAAQAAIRSGQVAVNENTAGTMGGVSESGIFPGPTVPTDIG